MNWRQLLSSEFLHFLLAGGTAAAANYGSRFFFSLFFDYSPAIVCAYLVGMLVAFLLMRGHVFEAKSGSLLPQALKFSAVNLLAVLQTLVISLVLARWLLPSMGVVEHSEAIAHLVGVVVPALTSYFGHKYLTFR